MPLEGHSAIFDNWSILVGKAFGLRKATYREFLILCEKPVLNDYLSLFLAK